jgi:hypothetical protein
MRRTLLSTTLAAIAALVLAAGTGAALSPGGKPTLKERVHVNVVFVGYEPDQISESQFLAQLPVKYQPVVRSRLLYGVVETLGIAYDYSYDVHWASSAWEARFFAALDGLATPAPLSIWQQAYNDQGGNLLDVANNHHIDAPSVERWLIRHAPPRVDTRKPTVFFINWYGRPGFKHHLYTKIGEPDPDTGFDFGVASTRRMLAWGGTAPDDEESGYGGVAHRVWFYDLSAGPEAWTDNWNVDEPDLDGDGVEEYRMPPVWEYAPGGYRDPSALDDDLGKVARYVFLNLLATTSPLYPPYLTPPRQPESINLDLNTFEGWPGVDASRDLRKPELLRKETSELLRTPVTVDNRDYPLTGKARECLIAFVAFEPTVNCYPEYAATYHPFASLFLFGALNVFQSRDVAQFADGGGEYEAVGLSFAMGGDLTELQTFLGYADDNWLDGTQSFTYNLVGPNVEGLYGLTTTEIHEFGHHWGMSHPHDGFDWETGTDYGPGGPFYFAWSGDQSNTMMSYIDLNWDFSQFDRDNYQRFATAAFIRSANQIAADVLANRNHFRAGGRLQQAAVMVALAEDHFAGHRYELAMDAARAAYRATREAAAIVGVPVTPSYAGYEVVGGGATTAAGRPAERRAHAADGAGAQHPHRFQR